MAMHGSPVNMQCLGRFDMVAMLLALAIASADEFTSGPQIGSTVPGQFLTIPVNGPDAGDETCLYCKYGNAPVVMVFASKPSEELARLVKSLEAAVGKSPEECGVCAIVTDESDATRRALGKLADDARLKRLILATVDSARVKDYELNPEAGVTVLMYSRKVVRWNDAFKPGKLDNKAIERIAAEANKHLGAK